MEKAKILVTGGAGYVGSVFISLFRENFSIVVVLDNESTGTFNALPDGVEVETCDICDVDRTKRLIEKHNPDVILHLAGRADPSDSMRQPLLYWKENCGGALSLHSALVQAFRDSPCPVIFASSCAVYGENASADCRSQGNLRPISAYGSSKVAAENIFLSSKLAKVIILRFFNVAGSCGNLGLGDVRVPLSAPQRLIPRLLREASGIKTETPCSLHGPSYKSSFRSYVHVADVAKVIFRAVSFVLKSTESYPEFKELPIVDVATEDATVEDIMTSVEKVTEVSLSKCLKVTSSHPQGDPIVVRGKVSLSNYQDVLEKDDWRREILCAPSYGRAEDIIRSSWQLLVKCGGARVTTGSTPLRRSFPFVSPWAPGIPIPVASQRSLVLLIRHGPREGGAFPSSETPLSEEGRQCTKEASIRLGNVPWASRALYSIKRCRETADLLLGSSRPDVELVACQLLGYDGPFMVDPLISNELVKKGSVQFLNDIINGKPVPGHLSRSFGVSRLFTDLKGFCEAGKILLAVSHDAIIAAVQAELGFPVHRWPDPLEGLLFDIEAISGHSISSESVSIQKLMIEPTERRPFLSLKVANAERVRRAYESKSFCEFSDLHPLRATVQTTDACNLSCGMCQRAGRQPLGNMDRRLFLAIADSLFPYLLEFCPTGIGEPLVWPHFSCILDACKSFGVALDMTTNGTGITPRLAVELALVSSDVKVLFDAPQKEEFERTRKGASFAEVVANVRSLVRAFRSVQAQDRFIDSRPTVSLQMTLCRSNFRFLPSLVEYGAELGVDRVSARHIFTSSAELEKECLVGDNRAMEELDLVVKRAQDTAKRVGMEFSGPEPSVSLGGEAQSWTPLGLEKCMLPWTEIFIDCDGTVFPCNSHGGESLGKADVDSLADGSVVRELWNGELQKRRRRCMTVGSPSGICMRCGNAVCRSSDTEPVVYDESGFKNSKADDALPYKWSARTSPFCLEGTTRGDRVSEECVALLSKPKLDAQRATLAVFGPVLADHANGGVDCHDHGAVLMRNGRVVWAIELERVSRVKHDGRIDRAISGILDSLLAEKLIRNDLKDVDLVCINLLDRVALDSCDGRFRLSLNPISKQDFGLIFPDTFSLGTIRNDVVKATFDGKEFAGSYLISHELAHIGAALPFSRDGSFPPATLGVHLDGAATRGNCSFWRLGESSFHCLDADWSLSWVSKLFNDNGIAFAILGEPRSAHLSVPGKLMGLAGHGEYSQRVEAWLKSHSFFHDCWSAEERNRFCELAKTEMGWKPTFDPFFSPKDKFLQSVAACIQHAFTELVVDKIAQMKRETCASNLVLSGGCALNIEANSEIIRRCGFDRVIIPPCCSDCGLALGSASVIEYFKHGAVFPHENSFLMCSTPSAAPCVEAPSALVVSEVVEAVLRGEVVGLCHGLGEIGPRALGARSIIGRADSVQIRDRVSMQMKQREWYRPIAPVMLVECLREVAEGYESVSVPEASRFMLVQFKIKNEFRSELAAVCHADGSTRAQVLFDRSDSPIFFDILKELKKSGLRAIINTSFNRRGEPLVQNRAEAIAAARRMGIDNLLVEGEVLHGDKLQRQSVVLVIHGYPPRYNAGSENYTQQLAHGLYDLGHNVCVVTRREDPFRPDYDVICESDSGREGIAVYLINHARSNARVQNADLDDVFRRILIERKPDVVHFGHLNHLSVGMVRIAHDAPVNACVLFTLHDYWLACPRGQFLEWGLSAGADVFPCCDGQDNRKCAMRCFNRLFVGDGGHGERDEKWMEDWVGRRMQCVFDIVPHVDAFASPSTYLGNRMKKEFFERQKHQWNLILADYGFEVGRLHRRSQFFNAIDPDTFVFGFIGRHHPSKGIDRLIRAFCGMKRKNAVLRIWGRTEGQLSLALRGLVVQLGGRVEWFPEYCNDDIFNAVFLKCDAIVVPSVWDENSPLVIHEALHCRVPVLTCDHGGMGEFVKDGVNGMTFRHRDEKDLMRKLDLAVDQRADLFGWAQRGYLQDPSGKGNVISSLEHARVMENLYDRLVTERRSCVLKKSIGPWRVTFDTNVTECNLHCMMCEVFSPFHAKNREHKRRIMPFDVIRKVVEELKSTGLRELVPSTMGEPLLYSHFADVVKLCADQQIRLNLTTNGTWPGKRSAKEWGELILPVASDIKVSWNGATAETQESVMRGSRFSTRLADLAEFVRVRDKCEYSATITLQVTFMSKNVQEMPDLIKMAVDLNLDRVKGHHLWVFYEEMAAQDLRRNSNSVAEWNRIVVRCHETAQLFPRKNGSKIKLEKFEPLTVEEDCESFGPAVEGICPFLGREAWINPEGEFSPCCAPSEQRKTLGEFGKVEDGLLSIWNSPAYDELCASYEQKELCKTCLLRRKSPDRSVSSVIEWKETLVAPDRSHHICAITKKPFYNARFHEVLSFHEHGLAAVTETRPPQIFAVDVKSVPSSDYSPSAYHIDIRGCPAYAERFDRSFGYYEGSAAVVLSCRWFHVDASGKERYAKRYLWCGNFQYSRCAVRLLNGFYRYLAVDESGDIVEIGDEFLYAGDFISARMAVALEKETGRPCLVNFSGHAVNFFADSVVHLQPFHKGFAVANDTRGFFHIGSDNVVPGEALSSDLVSSKRFGYLEPFYNGLAFFRDVGLSSCGLLNEKGQELELGAVDASRTP